MLSKLERYKIYLYAPAASLARVLYLRLSNDILRDSDILREHCTVHDDASIGVTKTAGETGRSSIIDKPVDEDNREDASDVGDDKIIRFLSSKPSVIKELNPCSRAPEREKISRLS